MGTNYVDNLLAKIDDESLRELLTIEFNKLRDNKEFGLIFERHIPEYIRLHNSKVAEGASVQIMDEKSDEFYSVIEIIGDDVVISDSDKEIKTVNINQLVVVHRHGEPIYPGLTEVNKVERGGDKPYHTVINAENYHALQLLLYTHEGKVDCIYIDPPYNTGAKDWKYNNDYVDSEDRFRHSKWLSFIEKRLKLAERLLNPNDSTLIITIDKNELFTLGMLLSQLFPTNEIQIVTMRINPRGHSRPGRISQVDEYVLIVYFGSAIIEDVFDGSGPVNVRWRYLRREDIESARGTPKGGPRQFYPIYVSKKTGRIVDIGAPLSPEVPRESAPSMKGCSTVFPVDKNNVEFNWGLSVDSLRSALNSGYVRVGKGTHEYQDFTFSYMSVNNISKVDEGIYTITGQREDGSNIVKDPRGKKITPTTILVDPKYDAGAYGSSLNSNLMPGKKFPFAKSLYSVEDILRFVLSSKKEAVVLDFFGGSGTTTHATARLNKQDSGRRQSILVTNNSVSHAEELSLTKRGYTPSDQEWKSLGIFHFLTLPRILAAITGNTAEGEPAEGEYISRDIFPISDGFEENVRFFELDYLNSDDIIRNKSFRNISSILWMISGGIGSVIEDVSETFRIQPEGEYGILFDIAYWQEFIDELKDVQSVRHVFIITDSGAQYQQVLKHLPTNINSIMLYEDYQRNFQIGA